MKGAAEKSDQLSVLFAELLQRIEKFDPIMKKPGSSIRDLQPNDRFHLEMYFNIIYDLLISPDDLTGERLDRFNYIFRLLWKWT